ncbi:MAG: MBL fold metallo-hydrolase [Phycisphaerales bacterium]|jgi:hydroxyacylglutathione hydrolase|nr:MBL fold metallo-hydrolase [Phycisphaerales bacterium]
MLAIRTVPLGSFQTNCIIISGPDGGECWVVDPGMRPGPAIEYVRSDGLNPTRILLTHGHCDHIAGADQFRDAFPGVLVCCPEKDAGMLTDPDTNLSGPFGIPMAIAQADETINPGQELTFGQTIWTVLDTAGHTPGGVSYYCPGEKLVIVGDSLFSMSIGRTDLPGSSHTQLIDNIRNNLLTLPDDTRVIPGHGPETSIGIERAMNQYLQ